MRWRDWRGIVRARPHTICTPRSLTELQAAVAGAQSVHAVGSGHGWTALAAVRDDGLLVDLRHLQRLLAVDIAHACIYVEAGITLQRLCTALDMLQLALPVVGGVLQQTLAGACATATHGSSVHAGTLSTCVRAIHLVDSSGASHLLRRGDAHFDAARTHLGALGVVYAMVIQCTRAKHVRTAHCWWPNVDALLGLAREQPTEPGASALTPEWLARAQRAAYWQLSCVPQTGETLETLYYDTATTTATTTHKASWWRVQGKHLLHRLCTSMLVGHLIAACCRWFLPVRAAAWMNRRGLRTYERITPTHGAAWYATSVRSRMHFEECEVSLLPSRLAEAVSRTRELCRVWNDVRRQPWIGTLTVRVCTVDRTALLSPAAPPRKANRGNELCIDNAYRVYLSLVLAEGPYAVEAVHAYAKAMVDYCDARPHWGKHHQLTSDDVRRLYGTRRLARFAAARAAYDPERHFGNAYLDACLA